jgi:2,4-dienoyl-CoA reductase (NADPH2)
MVLASEMPYKGKMRRFIHYMIKQVINENVRIRLGTKATASNVTEDKPDVVVIATGATRRVADLPGHEKMHVITAEDVISSEMEIGDTIVIVGGGQVGCEVAEYLADQGKDVTAVEMRGMLANGMETAHKKHLLNRLSMAGISIVLEAKATQAVEQGLIISTEEGRRELLVCDAIVMATPPIPDRELYNSLQGAIPELYLVGDCLEAGRISGALLEGIRVGREI